MDIQNVQSYVWYSEVVCHSLPIRRLPIWATEVVCQFDLSDLSGKESVREPLYSSLTSFFKPVQLAKEDFRGLYAFSIATFQFQSLIT